MARGMNSQDKKRRVKALIVSNGDQCVYCGSSDRLTLDHKIPRSCGGPNALWNLQLLCFDCNQAKADTGAGRATVLRWRGLPVPA